MKRVLLLLVLSCGGTQTTPVVPDKKPVATEDAEAVGMCTVEPAPCNDGGAPASSKDSGVSLVAPEAPLPPPKPSTIPLGKDPELVAGDDSFEKNDFAEAEKHYKAAHSVVGLARVRIARTGLPLDYAGAKGNKEVEAAVKELRAAAAKDDAYGPGHAELGRALLMLGDANGALASLQKAVALLPNDPEVHSALGIARLATGKADEAVASLQKASELDPGSAARHGNYGTVLLMRGRVPDAVKEYRLAVRIQPDDARSHSDLGTALLGDNKVQEALVELQKAIALDPNRATFHSNYGYALQIKGDMQQAIAEYRTAIKLDDKLASAWINLATALANTPSTRKEARAALEKAKALDPSDPRVKANLNELDALEKGH